MHYLLTLGGSLTSQVSWQRTLGEFLAEKGEYLLFKTVSAIRRSLPEDYEEKFSEQDVLTFLIIATAIGAITFAYILYRRDKKIL